MTDVHNHCYICHEHFIGSQIVYQVNVGTWADEKLGLLVRKMLVRVHEGCWRQYISQELRPEWENMEKAGEGFQLKVRRQELGIRQRELAQKLGIHGSRLCEFEYGRRRLSPELKARLIALLGLPPEKKEKGDKGRA